MKTIITKNHTIVVLEDSAKDLYYVINSDNEIAGYRLDETGNPVQSYRLSLPEERWFILGTITKDGLFDFDCSPYVWEFTDYTHLYEGELIPNCFDTEQESFLSLLASKGIELPKEDNKLLILIQDKL